MILKPLSLCLTRRSCAGPCCNACPSESGLKIGFGLSCGCSPELNLLPCSRDQPWIHFTAAGISIASCEEPVMGFPALHRSTLLSFQGLSPCSLIRAGSSHRQGWGGRSKLSSESEWPGTSLMGEFSGDNEEGRKSSRNLYPLTEAWIVVVQLWGVWITEMFWRWCTISKGLEARELQLVGEFQKSSLWWDFCITETSVVTRFTIKSTLIRMQKLTFLIWVKNEDRRQTRSHNDGWLCVVFRKY